MKFPCSGVILAGGRNSRFSGRNKALIRVGGKRIIDRTYVLFKDLFEEIILVTNDPLQYIEWNFDIVTDIFSLQSALAGIHTGLFFTTNPYAFFAACDTPFLKRELVETILEKIEPGVDIIIPETSEGLEPLCAAYSKQCLKPAEQYLAQRKFKIRQFFQKVRVKKLSEKILREKDPDLLSFFNINTPEELSTAEAIVK